MNTAKQILWAFYEKYHESHDIECTYLLIGLLNDNEIRVEVVKGSNLSKARDKFSNIISEHLYSLHKPLENLELLANSDPGDVSYSAIKCDACKERSDEEMYLLRWGTAARKAVTENIVNGNTMDLANPSRTDKNMTTKKNGSNTLFNMPKKSKNTEEAKSSFQKKDEASVERDRTSTDEIKEKKDAVEKDKNPMKKTNENKNKSPEKDKNSTGKNKTCAANSCGKKTSPKNKNTTQKKGLAHFFEKRTSPQQPAQSTPVEKNDDEINSDIVKEEKSKKEEKQARGRKRNRSKGIDRSSKKRKRVIVQSDSSDSEAQSDTEMENVIPELEAELEAEPPARTKSPSPPKMKHENGKKKVLKVVNKVYKEDGYIVTKKEHVYVSCSEDEEERKEEEERKQIKKMDAKMEKVKKKQSTLTDFFKKS